MTAALHTDLIYDVGLHLGEDSEFYLKKGFRVVAVEAVPKLAQLAAERLSAYVASGKLTILNVAIAERTGPLSFYTSPGRSVWGTASRDWAERNLHLGQPSVETTVQGVTFGSILAKHGVPYYLKIDIEGSDLLCLHALHGFEVKPKHVSIESSKTSWKDLVNEFDLLEGLGYKRFKVVPQHTVFRQRCPVPPREGDFVEHSFVPGATGLFGEEAPGRWLTKAEAMRRYRFIFAHYKLLGYEGPSTVRHKVQNALLRMRAPGPGWYDTFAMR